MPSQNIPRTYLLAGYKISLHIGNTSAGSNHRDYVLRFLIVVRNFRTDTSLLVFLKCQ